MGTRLNGNLIEPTILTFQLWQNSVKTDAHEVRLVTVHESEEDAIADVNVIQAIPSTSITRIGVGLYQYTVDTITSAGIYYDKIFITPELGEPELSFINTFELSEYYGTVPSHPSACTITGTITNGSGSGLEGVRITAIPSEAPSIFTGQQIALSPTAINSITNSDGYFELELLQNVNFVIIIKEIGYKEKIRIPNDTVTTSLWDLSPIKETGDPTPDDTGDTNW